MNLKTKILSFAFFAITSFGFAQSNCIELKGCERKLCELNAKLAVAKKEGNKSQIRGVEEAISETKKNCTTNTVMSALSKKVQEKQQEVQHRTDDLNKSLKEKDKLESKIDKKRKKLKQSQKELNKAIAAEKRK